MTITTYSKLSDLQKKLIDKADQVRKKFSYSPYSSYPVGAALLVENGRIITGTNFETVSYTGLHAEQVVIGRANAEGHRRYTHIGVIGGSKPDEICPVCGTCRQMIYQATIISGVKVKVIASSPNKEGIFVNSIGQLLPHAFAPRSL